MTIEQGEVSIVRIAYKGKEELLFRHNPTGFWRTIWIDDHKNSLNKIKAEDKYQDLFELFAQSAPDDVKQAVREAMKPEEIQRVPLPVNQTHIESMPVATR